MISFNSGCFRNGNRITIEYATPRSTIPFPCSSTGSTSRIANGNDAANGTFPFYVTFGSRGGAIIHSHYFLAHIPAVGSRIAYGLIEHQSFADASDPSYSEQLFIPAGHSFDH